jgi:hypothetical protein
MNFSKVVISLLAVTLSVIAYAVRAQTMANPDAVLLDAIYPVQDDSARALTTLAALYAPAPDKAGWSHAVCAGMTAGGCAYFKENQADDLWQSQSSNIGSSSGFIANVQTITEGTQLWKAHVTVFTPGKESKSDVFALVVRGKDGVWSVDRVLSGPCISLP